MTVDPGAGVINRSIAHSSDFLARLYEEDAARTADDYMRQWYTERALIWRWQAAKSRWLAEQQELVR